MMHGRPKNLLIGFFTVIVTLGVSPAKAQDIWDNLKAMPQTLGVEKGFLEVETTDFKIKLVKDAGTVASLIPKSDPSFDYSPFEHLDKRGGNGLYQLGDINLRIKSDASREWKAYSSAGNRHTVDSVQGTEHTLSATNLANTFPEDFPLEIIRYWEERNDKLILRFEITNRTDQSIWIGGLGLPLIFDNILHHKSLEEAHHQKVYFDPYIGMDAGYLQVSRLDGNGPVLLVTPYEKTPFEAYRPLLDDPTPRSVTFEGFHEWQIYTQAFTDDEWQGVSPWNSPHSKTLKAGESMEIGLTFSIGDKIRNIEEKLIQEGHPVAIGVPGYVLPQDVQGKLFLNYPAKISSIEIYPKGSLTVHKEKSKDADWSGYTIRGEKWGRSRLTVKYKDGTLQTIQYKVIKPETNVLNDLGNFLTNEQWYENPDDFFDRNHSVISYDYEERKKVLQDRRVWIAGLSDEGGAGSWLGAMMKQLVAPDSKEIDKLEQFVHETLWGVIQYKEGQFKYGVKKSLYYYEPDSMPQGTYDKNIDYSTWAAWSKKDAYSTGRSYNYPHVVAAYWVMYHLARHYEGLVDREVWDWYLNQAFESSLAMVEQAPHYAQFGQMEGSVFLYLLQDLQLEGWTEKALALENIMRKRADIWESLDFPFGSEMPWDSTGQEEVYMWSDYFGFDIKAEVTLNAILAYMPTVPHWGYNGSARRFWDFLYGGKISRIERQLHHYGSALNAIPVLKAYRDHPADLYLLRVGYAGMMGAMANITQEGFGPAAFHSFPNTLKIDPLSGDYGSGFYGYAVNNGAYLYKDERFGWLGFGGNVSHKKDEVSLRLTTGAKNAVFIAPTKAWVTTKAGKIMSASYNEKTKAVTLELTGDKHTPLAKIMVEAEGYHVEGDFELEGGMLIVPLALEETKQVVLTYGN
ncbi:DUF5695 domain-containing protein [Echinicola sp. 20G]|uniref:DUF5695 domain-containing protein n=1 Tax=Echinicola sp. 20G TaxID=2781961 RepID=UPI0019112108|nr:DUF5695 domain-containing protein [Echinicola sp. 20G]